MKDVSDADLINNIPLVSRASNWLSDKPLYIAGPCTVEDMDQMDTTGKELSNLGIQYLRGGAYKPLTFPYRNENMFEHREVGLTYLNIVKKKYNLKVVTEATSSNNLHILKEIADIIQIGSRSMYNYPLLVDVAKTGKPILLKRHFGASLRDWLGAAEYILNAGNHRVILCERGITTPHTHETTSRFIADVQVIPILKRITNLPVIIDPSHATFNRAIVPNITYAGMAAGADGFIIEAHPAPETAAVDPLNAITFSQLKSVIKKCNHIYKLVNE